jgi:hypothetical protein
VKRFIYNNGTVVCVNYAYVQYDSIWLRFDYFDFLDLQIIVV